MSSLWLYPPRTSAQFPGVKDGNFRIRSFFYRDAAGCHLPILSMLLLRNIPVCGTDRVSDELRRPAEESEPCRPCFRCLRRWSTAQLERKAQPSHGYCESVPRNNRNACESEWKVGIFNAGWVAEGAPPMISAKKLPLILLSHGTGGGSGVHFLGLRNTRVQWVYRRRR